MDRLRCIEVFLEVAQGLSFSAAAQRLGMANGNVTKHIAWLEKSMGVQLLLRATKSVNLTESGLALLGWRTGASCSTVLTVWKPLYA